MAYREGVSLFPSNGRTPRGLSRPLRERLGNHEDDEEEVEGRDHRCEEDDLGRAMVLVRYPCPQRWADH